MKLDLRDKKENKVFSRSELLLEGVTQNATPSRSEVLEAVSEALGGGKKELIVIDAVEQEFGSGKVKVRARVYQSKEAMDSMEPKWKTARGKKKEKKEGA
jgi:small subunit ribosomal protein S24e